MQIPGKPLVWLAAGLLLSAGEPCVRAQDATAAPTPSVAIPGDPPPYPLDLPELNPSPNGKLFPGGARPNPPATANGADRKNRRNPLTSKTKERGRSRDRTLQKADSDPLEVLVAYRRDKTIVLARDPELSQLLSRADAASTDVEKRRYLREYYQRLFAEVQRIDPSPGMKTHIALLAQVAAQRYDPQRRVVHGEEDLLVGNEAFRGRLGR